MSNTRRTREHSAAGLARPRRLWTGKQRDTGSTYVRPKEGGLGGRRAERMRAEGR